MIIPSLVFKHTLSSLSKENHWLQPNKEPEHANSSVSIDANKQALLMVFSSCCCPLTQNSSKQLRGTLCPLFDHCSEFVGRHVFAIPFCPCICWLSVSAGGGKKICNSILSFYFFMTATGIAFDWQHTTVAKHFMVLCLFLLSLCSETTNNLLNWKETHLFIPNLEICFFAATGIKEQINKGKSWRLL